MGTLRTRRPWTNKPPLGVGVNWSNPITQGLQVLFPTNEGCGVPIDAVSVQAATSASNVGWVAGPYTSAMDFVAASSSTVRVAQPSASFTGWSMACWFRIATATTGTVYIMSWTNTGDNSPIGAIAHNITGALPGLISLSWRNNSLASWRTDVNAQIYNDSKWHHIVGVFDPAGFKIYLDGTIPATTLSGTFPLTGTLTTNGLCLGSLQRTTNNYYTCSVDMPMAWNRLLSESEAYSIYSDPGQLFQPRKGAWLYANSGAAATKFPYHLFFRRGV